MTTFRFLLFSILLIPSSIFAQQKIEFEGINFRYELKKDSLLCYLLVPSTGWAMLGLNTKNSTEHADFKFFAITDQAVLTADCINVGGRNYPNDTELAGEQNIKLIDGKEAIGISQFSFLIPLKSKDKNDFQIEYDVPFYIILAYSVSDDFNHHSRVRQHFKIKISNHN